MFFTQMGSSKRDMKSRLHNIFDMKKKRRGIAGLCLIILCTLIGTGMVSSAPAVPDVLPGQLTAIDDLMVHASDIDGEWVFASTVKGNTWEEQIAAEMKWLEKVYKSKKSDFVITETLPVTEAAHTARLKYLYQNSKVFRNMSKMDGIFQIVEGETLPGFGLTYESGMMQRTAVMVSGDNPVTLEMDYTLSQGKIAVWLVDPNGQTVYQGDLSATCEDTQSFPGSEGLWSVIIIANSEDKMVQGDISIDLFSEEQDSQQAFTYSPEVFSVEELGKHTLAKGDTLEADIKWDGKGHVMLLYTDNKLTDNQILKPLQGLPYIPKYDKNKKDEDQGEIGTTFNFSQSTTSPLLWAKKITDPGDYYFYLIRIHSPGNVTGSVSIRKGNATLGWIWNS